MDELRLCYGNVGSGGNWAGDALGQLNYLQWNCCIAWWDVEALKMNGMKVECVTKWSVVMEKRGVEWWNGVFSCGME